MSLSHDLSPLLTSWPFDPTSVTARFVDCPEEGTQELQLRLDLGILQMRLNGRPDGSRPHDHDTALDFYRRKMVTDRRAGPKLDGDACAELQQECVQFYYRYLGLMVLKDFERVIRDTRHSLKIFDLVEKYAESDDLIWEFIQFKPYVYMMNTRAQAELLSTQGRVDEAVDCILKGMADIHEFLDALDEDEDAPSDCVELGMLEELIQDIRERRTEDNPVVRLKQKLQYAIHMENYEEAAQLRDRIKKIETDQAEDAPAPAYTGPGVMG
jgi:tetratricopeptide (TPR) repeat protein